MKFRKERDFVKAVCDENQFEVIISRIEILDISYDSKSKEIKAVQFQDRFNQCFEASRLRSGKSKLVKIIKTY